jgi:DNA-binding MarR family transcriptional regulator
VTGLSDPTVARSLSALEASGYLTLERGQRRAGWRADLTDVGRAAIAEFGLEPLTDATHPLPRPAVHGALVWLATPPRADERQAVDRLRREGAETVFECEGDVRLLAVYPAEAVRAARHLASDLARSGEFGPVGYTIVVDSSEPLAAGAPAGSRSARARGGAPADGLG